MSNGDFRTSIAEYIRQQALPPDKYSHQPRLYQLAVRLAAGQPYDDDILFAAAWLHDIGVFLGHRPENPAALATWDNVAYAVRIVPPLLVQWQFPAEKIPAVISAIATHQPAHEPERFEGVLLRDADILEQLGAITILRTVSKIGRDTRFHTFADALRQLQRQLDTVPQQLKTATARELAAPRIAILREFITAAYAEADGAPL